VTVSPDPNVRLTLLRWGNYDAITGGLNGTFWRFQFAGRSQSILSNPVPGSQTLPSSFYYSTKRDGGNRQSVASNRSGCFSGNIAGVVDMHLPFRTGLLHQCYEGQSGWYRSVVSFNSDTCYGAGSVLAILLPILPSSVRLSATVS